MWEQKRRGIQQIYRQELAIALVFIILLTVFAVQKQGGSIEFQFEDEQMTIVGPRGAPDPVTLSYADIRSISRRAGLALGNCESGLDTARCRFGVWRSGGLGRYTLCASPSVSEYIIMETEQGVVVFNYQDNDATVHLYTALVELLESKGMEVDAGAG